MFLSNGNPLWTKGDGTLSRPSSRGGRPGGSSSVSQTLFVVDGVTEHEVLSRLRLRGSEVVQPSRGSSNKKLSEYLKVL